MHPLMDVSGLTNEQLLQKIQKIATKIAIARKINLDSELVKQMNMVLFTYQNEMQDRAIIKEVTEASSEPCVWDMDSYLERNNDRNTEKESVPRWQSAVVDESSSDGGQPWDSDNPFGFD